MFSSKLALRSSIRSIAAWILIIVWVSGCASPPQFSRPVSPTPVPEKKLEQIPSHQLPRVMLLIDEKSMGTIPTAEVEALAIALLLERGVRVVDQDMVRSNIAKGQQMLKAVGDNYGAAALGLQFGADVIIMGEVVAKPSARRIAESNLRTYQAVATLRAVRTDNSSTIASTSAEDSVFALDDVSGSSKALKAAGAKALDTLIPAMLKGWVRTPASADAQTEANHIVLTIGGMDQAWKVQKIRQTLRSMADKVQNVNQRSYTTGIAVFEFDSLIPVEELSETLVLNPPEGLRLQILEVVPGKIDLKAVASQ